MKFAYQGIPGSYSENCIKLNYPDAEAISCRTFQDAFELAKKNDDIKALVPEQNQLIGSINIETLILKYRFKWIFIKPVKFYANNTFIIINRLN